MMRFLTTPSRLGVSVYLSLLLCLSLPVLAQTTRGATGDAIEWLLRDYPGHPLRRSTERLGAVSGAVDASAAKHDVPALLLVSMIYRESSFRQRAVGGLGERGLMQVGAGAVAHCACDLSTPRGQVDCGACWLRVGIDRCGSIEAGLVAYATRGGKCDPDDSGNPARVRFAVRRRVKLWRKLERRFGQ